MNFSRSVLEFESTTVEGAGNKAGKGLAIGLTLAMTVSVLINGKSAK